MFCTTGYQDSNMPSSGFNIFDLTRPRVSHLAAQWFFEQFAASSKQLVLPIMQLTPRTATFKRSSYQSAHTQQTKGTTSLRLQLTFRLIVCSQPIYDRCYETLNHFMHLNEQHKIYRYYNSVPDDDTCVLRLRATECIADKKCEMRDKEPFFLPSPHWP